VIRAASKLPRVPSSVTTRIKQLEARWGQAVSSDRQRLHLSPAGELLRDYAERLIQLSERRATSCPERAARRVQAGRAGEYDGNRLPSILAGFHGRYPDVRLELTTGTNDALVNQLVERKIDAAFIASRPRCARSIMSRFSPSG